MSDLMVWAGRYFLDPKLLLAFILLAIFLLLYLIRPKPRHQVMPTLMFLFKDMGKSKVNNFLRNLVTNLLFLLQFLLLFAIVAACAKPFIEVSKESLFKNTVIVIDTSASMQAPYEGSTRFDVAKKKAIENLGSVNTIIVVKKLPQIGVLDESAGKAKDFLSKLSVTDQPTNLYTAITAAGSYAKPDSRVVVISDFIDSGSAADLGTIRKTLESQGIKVDYIKLASDVPNIGIIDLSVSESKVTSVVKNYNSDPVKVRLKINDLSEDKEIAALSREVFTFTTPPRTSKLEMTIVEGKDDFKLDNEVFISAPSDVKKKVLFITNSKNYANTYFYNALSVMKNMDVTVAIPPKIPDLKGYDIYVFKDVDPNLILPGTFKSAHEEATKSGKAIVVMAQDSSLQINYQGILPILPEALKSEATNVIATGSDSITESIEFGSIQKYFSMKPVPDRVSIILAATIDKTPMIAYSKLGAGGVIYYGILDESKDAESYFAKSPAYFVFWKRAIDFATNTPSIRNLNFKTGSSIDFGESQRIETPEGKITTDKLILDRQGLYTLSDRTIAINLAEEMESDIARIQDIPEETFVAGGDRFKEKVPFELTDYLIIGALCLLFLELLYVKYRGDF